MFSSNTKEVASNLKNDIKEMKRDAKGTVISAKQDMEKSMDSDGYEPVTRFANDAGRTVRGYLETANDYVSDTTDKVNHEIQNNPLRSALIALGAGFIIGSLLRR